MLTNMQFSPGRLAAAIRRRARFAGLFTAAVLLTVIGGRAQNRASVPTPEHVLGYALGDRFSSHGLIEKYLFALRDSASDRVRLVPYGSTYEGRTLYLVIISAPENLGRLDEIKAGVRKLADPRTTTEEEAGKIASTSPAIAWLSYGVHGNEASSAEAGLSVMYRLASGTDEEITNLLTNLVIVIDPLLNPDGHERYVNYEITHSGAHAIEDKNAVEHNEDSPSGRTNHYYFDLNRDWAWLTQRETRARVKVYEEWKPQVVVDFHEMGYNSSYFFFPAFNPINTNFPRSTRMWADIYGKGNAAAFDKQGWNYWRGERFDLFYPGYGDSWPSLNGAIGMTYEQAGSVGVKVRRADDTILSLSDRIAHHSTTSFATLATTASHREQLLKDFHNFFRDALAEGSNGPIGTYIINPGTDPARAAKMASLLRQQGVEISEATKEFSADNLSTYFSPAKVSRNFPAGAFLISMRQPAKRLLNALMEQEPFLSDTVFYDISAWTLPVAYGVETYWTKAALSVPSAQVAEPDAPPGKPPEAKASYAYLMKSGSNNAMAALARLLQNDVKVRTALQAFRLNGETFPRGTLIIPVAGNAPNIHDVMTSAAQDYHLAVYSTNSGMTDSGITLGSDRAVSLKKPKIIVAAGSPVSSESYGAIWSMFDNMYDINFVPMKLSQIRNTDLHDYTTIIFPDDDAEGSGYRSQLDSNSVQRIKTWIAGGGTFIGIEGGAAFASGSVGKIAGVKLKEKKKEDEKKKDQVKEEKKGEGGREEQLSEEELEKRMTVEQRERKRRLDEIPGTMMRVSIDNSHPLGFGYEATAVVFKTTKTAFELSDRGYNVGIYAKTPRLSGYASAENEKFIAETPFLVHEQLGAGNVILFADDPNFRLFWDGLNKLFLNSVLLMPSIRSVSMTSDEDHQAYRNEK